MTLTQLFQQINSCYRGSDDDPPTSGTTDYTLWLLTTNRKISEWAGDNKNTWKSLFDIHTIGTVAAGTQAYDLDAELLSPSDAIIVTTTTGHDIEYTLCVPAERKRFLRAAYISGHDPQTLTFYDTIKSTDSIVGGAIKVPGYYAPDDMVSANDTVPVDDPYWLVYAVASELAFNDLTYSDKSPDLNAKANNLYDGMVSNNSRGTSGRPRIAITNVNRIPGTRNESTAWNN